MIKKVTRNVRIRIILPSAVDEPTIRQVTKVDKVTMATLMVLFKIRIVANKRFGSKRSFTSALSLGTSDFLHFSTSLWPSEKNATSEPETKAEKKRSRNSAKKLMT